MFSKIYFSFPVQIILNHFRRNYLLLIYWVLLFLVITNNLGSIVGASFLFLDPEYLNQVGFLSFFIVGVVLAGFVMAFNITGYIIDGHRFSFLGTMRRPFVKYCLNNSIIPLIFLVVYIVNIFRFQLNNELQSPWEVLNYIVGLLSGMILMFGLLFLYFQTTNKDLFKMIASEVNQQLKKLKATRSSLFRRYKTSRSRIRIDSYLDTSLKFKAISDEHRFYAQFEKEMILRVFDQNHLNSFIAELFILGLILMLGIFRDSPFFQIPAAASVILLLTIFFILTGTIYFWFRGWSILVVVVTALGINFLVKSEWLQEPNEAYGLNYGITPVEYSLQKINSINSPQDFLHDKNRGEIILKNWRRKFSPHKKPKMVLMCASGGGQRSSLWTMRAIQTADSLSGGKLFDQTFLITGASGGIIGASYFRELKLLEKTEKKINPYSSQYLDNIASDNLNSTLFSLLVSDLFIRYGQFEYNGFKYIRDRGTAFEEQLNKNTGYILDKKLKDYKVPEQKAIIPMVIMAPTITNDGRKLYISSQTVSYMGGAYPNPNPETKKIRGIDFIRLFQDHGSQDLRFLSALRMNATFPYITPNISLPTDPKIEIMDSGFSDNFGVSDAVHFLHVFRNWISENTSGVIILSVRDSPQEFAIEKRSERTFTERLFNPIRSIYNNWWNIQDLNNDHKIELARTWYKGRIYRVNLEYNLASPILDYESDVNRFKHVKFERASLNWRLTSREKKSIKENINSVANQKALRRLIFLLNN